MQKNLALRNIPSNITAAGTRYIHYRVPAHKLLRDCPRLFPFCIQHMAIGAVGVLDMFFVVFLGHENPVHFTVDWRGWLF